MAQFDVCLNPGPRRQESPLLLIVQSRSLDHLSTRLVMPLAIPTSRELVRSTLLLVVTGEIFVMSPHELFPVRARNIGSILDNLAEQSDAIIRAIDDVITRAYG